MLTGLGEHRGVRLGKPWPEDRTRRGGRRREDRQHVERGRCGSSNNGRTGEPREEAATIEARSRVVVRRGIVGHGRSPSSSKGRGGGGDLTWELGLASGR